MYTDVKPCSVCGSKVHLHPHSPTTEADGLAGPTDGVVGTADPTVDDRVCTNEDCPTNAAGGSSETPAP